MAPCGASAAPTSDAEVEQACLPSYDVGALKALFHHAQAVLEETHRFHTVVARGRGHSRASLSSSSTGPGGRDHQAPEASPSAPRCASEQSLRCGGGVGGVSLTGDHGGHEGVSDWKEDGHLNMATTLECEGAAAVVDTKSGLQKVVSPLESARILRETARRVSDLEARVLPRDNSDEDASLAANRAEGAEEQLIPESLAPGAGGGFARLVVIKELQPVPDHAPEDARHLLELTLDHQQVICLPGPWFVSGSMYHTKYEIRRNLVFWRSHLSTNTGADFRGHVQPQSCLGARFRNVVKRDFLIGNPQGRTLHPRPGKPRQRGDPVGRAGRCQREWIGIRGRGTLHPADNTNRER